MRIISQNGRIDLPYEHIVLAQDKAFPNTIVAYVINSDPVLFWPVAEYEDADQAAKVMCQLHKAYLKEKFMKEKTGIAHLATSKIWQFPGIQKPEG